MNIGGEPGRDDYGLPPVDIEIPDDARELDRDVQAYYRELRAERRRMLARRLAAPLSRDGMVLPLLAGCLALTLLAGTLLTVLTTGQGTFTPNRPPASSAKQRPRPAAGKPRTYLPDRLVEVNGQQTSLSALAGPVLVLALIPVACRCRADVQQLARLDNDARADTYLVGDGSQSAQLVALANHAGLGSAHTVTDTYSTLPKTYHPAKLTAVLVRTDGSIARFVPDPAGNSAFRSTLRSLSPAVSVSPASSPGR